jgi:hypothetical protein
MISVVIPDIQTELHHKENWGLITGRTSVFLLDPNNPNLRFKQRLASVQSHEVAHMWFGNITTMEWWTYLYLNEGFASLMGEVTILDKVFPEWNSDLSFINTHLNIAFNLDAKLSSHPIEVDCPNASDINQIFDALSYSKAASGESPSPLVRFATLNIFRQCCACCQTTSGRRSSSRAFQFTSRKGYTLTASPPIYGMASKMRLVRITHDYQSMSRLMLIPGIDVGKFMDKWITAVRALVFCLYIMS